MKILYKQTAGSSGSLEEYGITDCYFKQLSIGNDRISGTKPHHHTCFELHIITEGSQIYEVNSKQFQLDAGKFLLIFPAVNHRAIQTDPHTEKTAITFKLNIMPYCDCCFGTVTDRFSDSIALVLEEAVASKQTSYTLIQNRILEIIIAVLRLAGMTEPPAPVIPSENPTLSLARQYILDNIEQAPSVAEVAQYCCLSTKQLCRIFQLNDDISPMEYIKRERCRRIEYLIKNEALSLKEISEKMNFSSEYYFNAFFKKYAGQPPGEYRKMIGK